MIFSWLPTFFIIAISIISKLVSPANITVNDYFDFRYLMVATSIIPLLLFSVSQKKSLIIGLLPGFLLLLFFDRIHDFFHIGFFQSGFEDSTYFMTNVLVMISYFTLSGFIYSLKSFSEKFELQTEDQNRSLSLKNAELEKLYHRLEEQKNEIQVQAGELKKNNDRLLEVNRLVDLQKMELLHQNEQLELLVGERTKNLTEVTEELILHNNELRQFTYTLSHNLKAPTATLSGLLYLLNKEIEEPEKVKLLNMIQETINGMQSMFKDLSEIIELRHDVYPMNLSVNLSQEIESVKQLLSKEIQKLNVSINLKMSFGGVIHSSRQKLHSILFNLISNAIKYHHPERKPVIDIEVLNLNDFYEILVRDNGQGIDLEKHRDKMFQMYQRFHMDIEGKGMGLYLARLQAESLGGRIEVRSRIGEFTEFRVLIKRQNNN
jgi:signal transduction histidine kinase